MKSTNKLAISNIKSGITNLKQQKKDIIARLELSREYGAPSSSKIQQEGVYENQIKRLTRMITEAERKLTELKKEVSS